MQDKIRRLKSRLMHGVTPAMATPLQADGYQVNAAVVPSLIHFLIDAGVKGVFVGGTTGEGILLDLNERMRLHEAAVTAADGRFPVLLHVGANRLDEAVTLARHAAAVEADAVVAITPTFYGMDEDSLASYYHALAEAAPETPLMLYDIPHMAVNGITPGLLTRLGEELPTLAGIKSSRPDAQAVRQLIGAAPDRAVILAGNERIALGLLALGAHGLISGLSTAVPEPFVAMTDAFANGRLVAARQAQSRINAMLDQLPPKRRIGAIKRILEERGLSVGAAVPPRSAHESGLWSRIAPLASL
ncbi:MAG: dihydrodipicolinate synthase family protein [Anaerolineae bacterium]